MAAETQNDLAVWQIILESISDGVFTVDHTWRITSFNRAAEKITGIGREEALGRYCWEVFRANMCEEDCALKRSMQEGRSFVSSSTYMINGRRERIPISVSTSPLVNGDGEILGGVETFRDHSLVEELQRELAGSWAEGEMVSRSREMAKIFSVLPQIAGSEATVLIQGETGTGKELLARTIHNLSGRSMGKFIAINCGALPDSLLESELFGYKAGAFTGADRDKPGLLSAAADGTVLLDEIGDTSPSFQVRLLRVLEEREFHPLGSIETMPVTARVITATNRDLAAMVTEGTFRQDLYYRINVVRLLVPPLRDRAEDIPLLIKHFVNALNVRQGKALTGVDDEAMRVLLGHNYPGNIRELHNIIEHAFVLCREGQIGQHHLPGSLSTAPQPVASRESDPDRPLPSLETALQSAEEMAITEALQRHGYNRKAAAAALGMHKSTLHRKLRKLQINLPPLDGRSNP